MITEEDREALVRDNTESERRVLATIFQLTGIRLPKLQFARDLQGAQRELLMDKAQEFLEDEANAFVRNCFYAMFRGPFKAGQMESLLAWHTRESDPECLRTLDLVLSKNRDKALAGRILAHMAKVPERLRVDGIVHVSQAAENSEALLLELRAHFERRRYDLECLSVVANLHERLYNRIAEAPPFGATRLTGRQCVALMHEQLPDQEYGFRRAELIPYYGRVADRATVSQGDLATTIGALAARHKLDGRSPELALLVARVKVSGAVPVLVDNRSGGTKAIILAAVEENAAQRRHDHRKAAHSGSPTMLAHELIVVEVAPPEEWNLLPKKLLPADHPIRFVRPEDD